MDHEVTETMQERVVGDEPAVGFVGAGRAGSALALALARAGYRVRAISSRTAADARRLADAVSAEVVADAAAAAERCDLLFLTVPDPAISPVAGSLGPAAQHKRVVHCSARLGPDELRPARDAGATVGVLHPLQALAGASSAGSLTGAYFRVEAETGLHHELASLVARLRGHVLEIRPDNRDLYHAAAVLAGNAPLALLAEATMLLEHCGLDPATAHDALGRLLEGAAANARRAKPGEALTGPVVRGDEAAIAAHLEALQPYPLTRELYEQLVLEMARLLATPAQGQSLHRVA